MERKKILSAIIVGGFIAIISFILLVFTSKISYGNMIQEYVNTDIYSVLSEQNVELRDGEKVYQQVLNKRGNLYSFSLKVLRNDISKNESLKNNPIQVTLIDCDSDNIIQSWSVDESDIQFDGYCEFVLDKKADGVQNKLFAIEIETDSEGYVLGGTQNDSLKGGELYINDAVQEGDLAIKLSSENNVWITLFYGIGFCLLLGIISGSVVYFAPQKKVAQKVCEWKAKSDYKKMVQVVIGSILLVIVGISIEKILLSSGLIFSGMYEDFNEYRCAFLIVCMLLVYHFFQFQDCFEKKPEKLFLLSFILIGVLFVISMPGEAEISWDESIHYWRSVAVSHALDGKANYAENWLYWHSGIGYTLPNSIGSLRAGQMNIQALYNMGLEMAADTSILHDWSMIVYLPAAIGLIIGRILHLPYALIFHLGAAMNMIVYVIVLYYAMKRLSSGKMILAVIGGIPVSMFLASVYSYDSWIVAFSILGISYFIGSMQDGHVRNKDMIMMILSFSLAFIPKEIYFPLFLLYLLLPKKMFENEKKYRLFCVTTGALFCTYAIGMVIRLPKLLFAFIFCWLGIYFLVQMLGKLNKRKRILVITMLFVVIGIAGIVFVYTVLPQMLGVGDMRGGDTVNSAVQVHFIMENPMEYTMILLRFLKNHYLAFQVEMQGLFNTFGYIGKSGYALISFVFLWIVAFTDKKKDDMWDRYHFTRIASIILGGMTICLIATGLYVSFTPVGLDTVLGCQIRYIMPLMFPFFAVIGSNRIQNNMTGKHYNAIVLSCVNGLLLLNLWEIVIQSYS